MALFPAYGKTAEKGGKSPEEDFERPISIDSDIEDGCSISPEREEKLLDSVEEVAIVKSNDSSNDSECAKDEKSSKKRKHRSKRKKDKKRPKICEKYTYHSVVDYGADYYVDSKIDYGNLRVSTLYNPARPHYDHLSTILGFLKRRPAKKSSKPKRYYNTKLEISSDKQVDVKKTKKPGRPKKEMEDYIDITDSGITWNDSRLEEDLVEQTARFNKYLNTNPYDVDMWLKYAKLQEDRMAFDICNGRVSSEAAARNICLAKQISILDKALEKNYNSMDLLAKKVKLSEQSLPNDQYLAMLKGLVLMPELSTVLLTRVWFWYVDAVQCSMALCSVPSVKEMYVAAIKGLVKVQGENYQKSHVDVTYRLGLFLRQAGMWEQLWMLVKMNMEINLAASRNQGTTSLDQILPAIDEATLISNETKIISSGLPLHSVWSRVETLRSREHWFPVDSEADDPQRIVFSTDLADFIKPVTQKSHQFTLIVNILRLYKVPLLPLRHTLLTALTPNEATIDWEYDSIESCLPFVYSIISGVGVTDPVQIKLLATVIKDFSEEPNYFDVTGSYYKLVNNLMVQSAKWFSGMETTAILIWWIRLQRCILTAIRWKDTNDQKASFNVVRKLVKDVLKSNREDVLLYGEFAAFEGQLFGQSRGISVLETALRATPCDRNIARVHLSRVYVEMSLAGRCDVQSIVRSINVLISVATSSPLPKDLLSVCSDQTIEDTLEMFNDHTDKLLLAVSDFEREMLLCEHMVPDTTADWICCHGWLLYLTQTSDALERFYKKLNAATYVQRVENKALDSKRQLWLRENILEWFITVAQSQIRVSPDPSRDSLLSSRKLLLQGMEEFPNSGLMSWKGAADLGRSGPVGRLKLVNMLTSTDCPSQALAIAFLLINFVHLYQKEVPLYEDLWQPGHGHRLRALLQALSLRPALQRSALLWKMYLHFAASHSHQSLDFAKRVLYRALDECPWDKGLYRLGCVLIPPEFAELVDLMVEKQIRLHAMPEELQPL